MAVLVIFSLHDHTVLLLQLIYAARQSDWPMFEYLVERRPITSTAAESDADVQAVMQRRESWVVAARTLAHQHRIPLSAVRTIHEYVVGFNWSAVCEAIA